MPDPSPHGSLVMYDPNSCDLNVQTSLNTRQERTDKLLAFYAEHVGQLLYLKHAKHGNIKPVVITPTGPQGRAGWVWCEHILFGFWRLASAEDVAAFKADIAAKARLAATQDARRMAQASGLVLKDMAETAKTIADFSKQQPPPAPVTPLVSPVLPQHGPNNEGPRCEDVAAPVPETPVETPPAPPVDAPAPKPRGRRKKAQP